MSSSPDAAFAPLRAAQTGLWVVALLFYGVGDSVTTYLGLRAGNVSEAGPVAVHLIDTGGIGALVLLKLGLFAACFGIWGAVRTPGRVAIPLALAVTGVLVTAWNTVILLT